MEALSTATLKALNEATPPAYGAASEILLITKTVTQNQGNQALSIAWRDTLSACFPDHKVRPVERIPAYLKQFQLRRFAGSSDPVAAFDAVARGLLALLPRQPGVRPAINPVIGHDSKIRQAVHFRRLRRLLSLRSRFASFGLAKRAYVDRLALFRGAAMVVVNPAGEFYPHATDTAVAYLLDVRCAQLLGVPTATVNLSFEVADPTVRRLSTFVLDQCDLLELRDSESQLEYAAAGGRRIPLVLPDAALLTKRPLPAAGDAPRGSVALAINGLQVRDAHLESDWLAFLDRMLAAGLRPTLTSNEWSTDEAFWGPLLAKRNITAVGQEADYRAYMKLLAGFEIVVSSRLHTCVLAMVAGSIVIPVESGTFKLTGFFKQAGFTDLPVRLGSPGWQDAILARIGSAQADPASMRTIQNARRDAARRHLYEGITDAFCGLGLAAQLAVTA